MGNEILNGGVAVITGAASGIGAGLARAAAARGMKLVLADIAPAALFAVGADLEAAGSEVLAVPTDVADPTAMDRLAEATFERFGGVRLLVNNAGIESVGNVWEFSAVQWERAIHINVLGPVNGVRAFAPAMLAAGEPAFIANVASLGALGMMAQQTPYIMSKHAILSFSECLSLEMSMAAPAISVSAVLPGPVATRIFADAQESGTSPDGSQHRQTMENLIAAYGRPPDEAGRIILDQIVAGQFWVTTHPAMLAEYALARAAHLTTRAMPALTEEAMALLNKTQ
jgi:NAD(P)-dependent dehydrogenase (short-subunit alcohol dehydrogenase family)